MHLYIAEKPSLARAIAEYLGILSNEQGHIRCKNDTVVTHCFGHMYELAPPERYNPKWKAWNMADLPIVVPAGGWLLEPRKSAGGQLAVIKYLLSKAHTVYHAGDPGREGQLLIDEVLEEMRWKGPTKRLLLNATDPASVAKQMARMQSNDENKALLYAAKCRQRADWLIGMILSRAVTLTLSQSQMVSIGRVQTPTLGLVVKRDLEIENFSSRPFYTINASVACRETNGNNAYVVLSHDPSPRIHEPVVADAIKKSIENKKVVLHVKPDTVHENAPLPHDLGDFQKEAENAFGWGVSKSLDVLQNLYEAKLASYPRVECRYLPTEQAAQAQSIAASVISYLQLEPTQAKWALANCAPKKRVYDSSKVGEHHGIIPTGLLPSSSASPDMQKAFMLVVRRFVQQLLPDHVFLQTVISFETNEAVTGDSAPVARTFQTKGNQPGNIRESWKVLSPPSPKAKSTKDEAPVDLPAIADATPGQITKAAIATGKTTPPKHYTEASLVADMKSAAKFVSGEKAKEVLKETKGIGTAATQAPTVETLKARGFITFEGKKLISTTLGREVIKAVPPALYDVGLTATVEETLGLVAEGKYSPHEFMRRISVLNETRMKEIVQRRADGFRIMATAATPTAKTTKKRAAKPGKTPGTRTPRKQSGPKIAPPPF